MNGADENKAGIKKKIVHEMTDMLLISLYLALFFCSFTTYRRLVSHELGIDFLNYGFALVKALVLAKVILLGRYVRFGRIFDDRPLIYPTLYKVVIFSLFTLVFAVLEHLVRGFFHGEDLVGVFQEIIGLGRDELLARTLVVLFAFVPFFAFSEIGRVLGEGRLGALFLKTRPTAKTDPTGG
jgi:hypothetical protein